MGTSISAEHMPPSAEWRIETVASVHQNVNTYLPDYTVSPTDGCMKSLLVMSRRFFLIQNDAYTFTAYFTMLSEFKHVTIALWGHAVA
jgi:hypothetical protein